MTMCNLSCTPHLELGYSQMLGFDLIPRVGAGRTNAKKRQGGTENGTAGVHGAYHLILDGWGPLLQH